MKATVKIVSFSVLHDAVSIRILCENANWVTNEARDEQKKVTLDDFYFEAKIRSINIQREGVNLLLRAKKNRYIVNRLYDLMNKECNELSISEDLGPKLHGLLSRVSKRTGESAGELLYRLTTFKDKEGRVVQGKMSIDNLSEGQKVIVIKKLNTMLREGFGECLAS